MAEVAPNPSLDEDARIELLLSEKLMDGYVLLEKSCPVCANPLVKSHADHDEEQSTASSVKLNKPLMLSKHTLPKPFRPVAGVPFCVSCASHVITEESEIAILERVDSFKNKEEVLIALEDTQSFTTSQASRKEIFVGDVEAPLVIDSEELIDVTGMSSPPHATPKGGKPPRSSRELHADEKKDDSPEKEDPSYGNDEDVMAEYSVRREIATKVLGAKMLQGYTLKETQCGKCGMPMMEYKSKMECVVCPALLKKARKKMRAEQKLAEETARLEREIQAKKAEEVAAEKKRLEQQLAEGKALHEHEAKKHQQRLAELEREQQIAQDRNREEEKARLMVVQEKEKARIAALEKEEARLLAEAKAKTDADQATYDQQLQQAKLANKEALEKFRKEKEALLSEDVKKASEKRKVEEQKLMEETKRLEQLEARRKMALLSTAESMKVDLLAKEHRERLASKAQLDADILRLENERLVEELEVRKFQEEKRVMEEAKMIETLEQEAAAKASAAELAIKQAKAALEQNSTT